jgi:hypothetical protein
MKAIGGNRFPSMARMAGNAFAATARVARASLAGQPIRVPPDVLRAREMICAACDENLAGRCKKCGCGVRSQLIRKTHLATEQCPLSPPKWPRYQLNAVE